jgi:hypothetical protein
MAAIGGLRPTPVVGPDTPDGVPVPAAGTQENQTVHAGSAGADVPSREKGSAMKTARPFGIASLAMAAGLGLAGCQTAASGSEAQDAINAAASVETDAAGGPSTLILTAESVERLGIETAPVEGEAGALSIPYAAVVYDAEGATWAFVEVDERTYQREALTITSIDGDSVQLSEGPEPGADVVIVGGAELVGVEAGISGGE